MSCPLFALFHLKHCNKFYYYVIPAAILYHISHLNYLKIILGPYDDHYIIIGPMPPSGHIVLPTFKIQIMFSQSGPKISCYWRGSLFQVICDITFACLLYRIMKSVSTALFQSITRMYCTMSAISYQGKTHYWTRWDPTPLFKTAVWYTFFCTSLILQPEAWQKHELLVCWISVNFLWWNLNLRIRSLGTFTRPSNSRLNQSLPSPGDGGGQMFVSMCPGWQHWQNRVSYDE